MPEKATQGRFLIDSRLSIKGNEGLLLAHTTLSAKLHKYLIQRNW